MDQKSEMNKKRGGGGSGRQIAVDLIDEKPSKHHMLPVWFFIGLILLTYGAIILVTGIYEISHPPPTVLASLHAPIWWGGLLGIIGAVYILKYRPHGQ